MKYTSRNTDPSLVIRTKADRESEREEEVAWDDHLNPSHSVTGRSGVADASWPAEKHQALIVLDCM